MFLWGGCLEHESSQWVEFRQWRSLETDDGSGGGGGAACREGIAIRLCLVAGHVGVLGRHELKRLRGTLAVDFWTYRLMGLARRFLAQG